MVSLSFFCLHSMQHLQIRSHRFRNKKTSPMQAWGPPTCRSTYPAVSMPPQASHQQRSKWERGASGKPSLSSLQEASFPRQVQDLAASLPDHRLAPALLRENPRRSLTAKALPQHFALEGETSKLLPEHPPNQHEQLDSAQLEHMMLKIEALQKVVRKLARGRLPPTLTAELAADDCNKNKHNTTNNTNNSNNNTNTNNNNDSNNDDNNYNSNNKSSQESGLNSFDLDNDNPESEPDLDSTSLGSLSPTLCVESSSRSLDQHEANPSLNTKGQQKTMTIGISLGNLIQQNQDGQEGMQIGTAWEPSLEPKKRVSFDETNLAYNKQQQNNRQQEKRVAHNELPA